jgi:tyrosyl-tRNA synthetase
MTKVDQELLTRGVEDIIVKAELERALEEGKKLRIYYGVDPSGPIIHLGHAVHLRKLQKFQELGHKIIFLIGDFTGMIGDPTDRTAASQPLTREEVLENAKSYKKQVSRFLKFEGNNAAEIRFNSEWNDQLNFKDVIELASRFTVQQLLERDMFQKRIADQKPISLHEFLYPVVQGYDAVMLDADMQMGGTDQTFNMIQGRHLMKALKNKTQMVMTLKLLEGTDGRKMSKSFHNIIAIEDDPNEMFGKLMSIKDDLIMQYLLLTTDLPMGEIDMIRIDLENGMNPRDAKIILAKAVVTMYHSEKDAEEAAQNFENIFAKKELPKDMTVVDIMDKEWPIVELLSYAKLAPSKSEARRLIDQGGVRIDGAVIGDREAIIRPNDGMIVQVGKRKFIKIKLDK